MPPVPKLLVTQLLEAELPSPPAATDLAAWRRGADAAPSPSSVHGALSQVEGLAVEHAGVHATVLWFASKVLRGERALVAAVELRTPEAWAIVLEAERGFERSLGVPAAPDAKARVAEHLRAAIEAYLADGALPEEHFRCTVAEFLRALPAGAAAPAPEASLGRWILDHGLAELVQLDGGVLGALDLPRGQRLTAQLLPEGDALEREKDGISVALAVALRRTGKTGKLLDSTEQPVPMGFLGADAMFEAAPDEARRAAAREALRRWRAEVARRVPGMPTKGASLMPTDLPWPTPPVALAVQALRHGAPGPRPAAGRLGDLARERARELRESNHPDARLPGAMRAWEVGGFTLVLRRCEDEDEDEEGRVEESCWARRGVGPLLPIVFWIEDERAAFSPDADEPAMRLFAEWMRFALATSGLDRELPTGVRPSEWWSLGDRDGGPLDHRVEEGLVSGRSYADAEEALVSIGAAANAAAATDLLRALVRELVDPEARFGLRVAGLGMP